MCIRDRNIGSYAFGCVSDWDLTDADRPEYHPSTKMVSFNNYPTEFSELYDDREFWNYDTTVDWAVTNLRPALWSEIDGPVINGDLCDKYREVYHTTHDFGMKNGAIIPLRKYNDVSLGGIVVFTDPELKEPQADRLLNERMAKMKFLAETFHLYRPLRTITQDIFNITMREKECLQYLCHGNSIKQIGFILGTHERTVQKQIASAKKKLGAHSMLQAVVKALVYELIDP